MKRARKEYCCQRFAEYVKEKEIIYSTNDETEWFVPNFGHLYFCPFCGAFIKGKGWGNYDKLLSKKTKKV
ncbi:hypothetical protein ACFL2Y_02470 [Candidatus Omnitrophota bacterium]